MPSSRTGTASKLVMKGRIRVSCTILMLMEEPYHTVCMFTVATEQGINDTCVRMEAVMDAKINAKGKLNCIK